MFNVLLQILDDGRLTDGQGRTVSFRNTVIVMTSNVGTGMVEQEHHRLLGARARTRSSEERASGCWTRCAQQFRPEFLNRVDDIIVFNALSARASGARSWTSSCKTWPDC